MGEISRISVIARGVGVRQAAELDEAYGRGQWRKVKGIAMVRLRGGELVRCELHWYEAHGIGRRRLKIKRFLD